MIAVMVELCTSAIIGQQQSISYIWKRRADEAKSECKVYELPRLSYYSPFTYKCHKSNIKNLLMKSSEIVFIFLPAFYLIIWLITSPKNSEKISILKIWQLVFFRVVKLCFGKFLLKWCIFRLEKYDSHK